MQFTIKDRTPEEILAEAVEHMVEAGAWVKAQGAGSITFAVNRTTGRGWSALWAYLRVLDSKNAGSWMTAAETAEKEKEYSATLSARAIEGGTRVTLANEGDPTNKMLAGWIKADVLKESLPGPLTKLGGGRYRLDVWTDRVEVFKGLTFMRKIETIPMADISALVVKKEKTLVLETRDGKEFSVRNLKQFVRETRDLIDQRIAVHTS
jgi:hypothetical protein